MNDSARLLEVRMSAQALAEEVVDEVVRATVKHGDEAMTAKLDVGRRLGILGEEHGEVCRATTYDNGSREELRKELVQLAAMSLAWLVAEFQP